MRCTARASFRWSHPGAATAASADTPGCLARLRLRAARERSRAGRRREGRSPGGLEEAAIERRDRGAAEELEVVAHVVAQEREHGVDARLAVGTEANSGPDISSTNGAILQALRRGAGDSLNQTGQQVVRRNLNIQPTLTIRPGLPGRVLVNRDLVLETYKG